MADGHPGRGTAGARRPGAVAVRDVLVGESGSGKSTLVEAVADAFGLSPEGGSTQGKHSTRPTESPLGRSVRLQPGLGASRWGFFLRAETMHGWCTFSEQTRGGRAITR